jgi:hypothetical protein
MGIFRDDEAPPLHVPDLSPSAGSVVAVDGTVACVMCGTRLPLAQADVVGLGYRCAPCTRRSEIQSLQMGTADNSANLDGRDRDGLRAAAMRYASIGGLVLGAGVVVAMIVPRLGMYVVIVGVGFLLLAAMRWGAAR